MGVTFILTFVLNPNFVYGVLVLYCADNMVIVMI